MDIKLIPTEDLITEIFHRFDSAVFCGHQVLADKGPMKGVKSRYRRWCGDRTVCAGLGMEVALCCAGDQLQLETPGEDG